MTLYSPNSDSNIQVSDARSRKHGGCSPGVSHIKEAPDVKLIHIRRLFSHLFSHRLSVHPLFLHHPVTVRGIKRMTSIRAAAIIRYGVQIAWSPTKANFVSVTA